MGPGVKQVLALEVNLCTAEFLGQAFGQIEGGGAADKLAEEIIKFLLEGGILAGGLVFALQVEQRRHQGLGHEATAVRTEVAVRVGNARDVG